MYETLKMFNQVNTKSLDGKSLEEVVQKFRSSTSVLEKNRCYVYIFKNLYPMIISIMNKYIQLDALDKSEYACELLHRAIVKFKLDKKVKFSTFFYQNLTNGYINMVVASNSVKRKVWQEVLTLPEDKLAYKLSNLKANENTELYRQFYSELDSSILEGAEVDYCRAVLEGYRKEAEILDFMHKESFRYNRNMDNPIKNLTKIKKSVRKKLSANAFNLWESNSVEY